MSADPDLPPQQGEQFQAVVAIEKFAHADALVLVVQADGRAIPGVFFGGDGQAGSVARELPATLGCVIAFVDTNAVFAQGDDMSVLQFPVDVVQGACLLYTSDAADDR